MGRKRTSQVKDELVHMISSQKLAGNKLPPEALLSTRLGVSRGTVREAMQTLVGEGIISKKHGIGNFVHRSAVGAKMRVDAIQDFILLIENGGYKARMEKIASSSEIVIGDVFFERISGLLSVGEKSELRTLQSVFYADGQPAIYSQVFLSKEIILKNPDLTVKNTLFEFLNEFCNQTIEQTLIYFKPLLADERESKVLHVEQGTPMIAWEEYYYNLYDEAICAAMTYFHPDYMHLCMLRKVQPEQKN